MAQYLIISDGQIQSQVEATSVKHAVEDYLSARVGVGLRNPSEYLDVFRIAAEQRVQLVQRTGWDVVDAPSGPSSVYSE